MEVVMRQVLIVFMVVFSVAGASSAPDGESHAKCAQFFNNPEASNGGRYYSRRKDYAFAPNRLHFQPFKIKDDGDIKTYTGTDIKTQVNHTNDGEPWTEMTIEYPIKKLEVLESMKLGEKTPMKPQKAKVVIKRDKQGNLIEITEDFNFSKAEVDRMMKERAKYRKSGELLLVPSGSVTKFATTKDGQCVPVESRELLIKERSKINKDGSYQKYESTSYITELCHEINEFISESPEIKKCFNEQQNKAINEILGKYTEQMNKPLDSSREVLTSPWLKSHFINKAYKSRILNNSLDLQLAFGVHSANHSPKLQKRVLANPLLLGGVITANCYYRGLGPFMGDDNSFWEESPSGESTSNGAKVISDQGP